MTQDELIQIVRSTKVEFALGARQKSNKQVRFLNGASDRSLNLGFSERNKSFVADFVFKDEDGRKNEADFAAFVHLFGGARGNRKTVFARLEPPLQRVDWLKKVIQAYWAAGERPIA